MLRTLSAPSIPGPSDEHGLLGNSKDTYLQCGASVASLHVMSSAGVVVNKESVFLGFFLTFLVNSRFSNTSQGHTWSDLNGS